MKKLEKQVSEIILNYCEGIYHLEFQIEDLGKMSKEIVSCVNNHNLTE